MENIDLEKKLEILNNKIEENNKILEIIFEIINHICFKKDFLLIENNDIFFYYENLYDSETGELNENHRFIYNLSNNYSESIDLVYGQSSGEKSLIELMACMTKLVDTMNIDFNKKSIKCYILLDEIEESLHPEWCRKLYKRISDTINHCKTNHRFYIYMSTHSPYVISDFTSDHIIYLESNEGMDFNTFGANIHDILNKGMFLSNSMGEFACQCITNLITDLEGNSDEPTYDDETTEYIINCIGEPFIKNHLKLLYEKKKKRKMLQKYEHMTKEELIELIERKEHDQNRN